MSAAPLALAGHWAIAPILVSLGAGALLAAIAGAPLRVQRIVGGAATLAQLAIAALLVQHAATGAQLAYALGDWAAPFGIFLLVDRLAAWMLLVTAVVAVAAFAYACAQDDREGPYFHSLFQFQLLGIVGAFLTADLFNLFVFFEILLIASYALLLHGATAERVRTGVHVVVLNLAGSALFLVAVACIYGAVGTLNLADLAIKAPAVPAEDAGLVQVGAFLLLVVFALKAAALPLGFWLPSAYSAAPAGVAALFAVLTKVGVYAIMRFYTLAFPCFDAGPCGPSGLVLPLGLATLTIGALGALAASRLRPLSGHLVLVSIGTLLVAAGTFRIGGHTAAVYYIAHSTFAGAALFLVADLVARQRVRLGDRLDEGEPVRQTALLATLYAASAIAIVGLPPLSGFVGKLAVMQATIPDAERVWTLVLLSTLFAVIVTARAGSALFWRTGGGGSKGVAAPWPASAAAAFVVGALAVLTVAAGPAFEYAHATARQMLERRGYVEAVFAVQSLSAPLPAGTPATAGDRESAVPSTAAPVQEIDGGGPEDAP